MSTSFLSGDGALVRRSRYGDAHAARRLATRHLDRITLLASVVATTPEDATTLTRRGFRLALRSPGPFEDALVHSFGKLAAQRPDAVHAQGRLLVLLVEVDGRPSAEVAALLGLEAAVARAMLPAARAAAGPAHPARPCRGWGLVGATAALTDPERVAGEAHLSLCRRCRDRRAAVERTRAQLLGGSAGAVGAVAATQVVQLGGGAGLTLALGGKAAAAIVGGTASVVLATASTVAVTEPARFDPAPRPAVTTRTVEPAPSTGAGASAPAPRPSASPSSGGGLPALPVPLPTGLPRSNEGVLPTSIPTSKPTVLPTSIPLPLPSPLTSLLPVPLPTALELPALTP